MLQLQFDFTLMTTIVTARQHEAVKLQLEQQRDLQAITVLTGYTKGKILALSIQARARISVSQELQMTSRIPVINVGHFTQTEIVQHLEKCFKSGG